MGFFYSCSSDDDSNLTTSLSAFSLDSTDVPFYYSQSDSGFILLSTFMSSNCASLDPDLSGNDVISICVANQPLSIGLSETYASITSVIPNTEISVLSHIDTLCVYSDTISDSVIYTYKVNYHPDSVYPAGYLIQPNSQNFAKPHFYGELIDPSTLNFIDLTVGIKLVYAKNGSASIPTSEVTITNFTNYTTGPWLGAGKKCLVFKFTGIGNYIYCGWIELEVTDPGTVHVYSIYCHQFS